MANDTIIKKSNFERDRKRTRVLDECNFEIDRRDSREILDNEEKFLNQETEESSVNRAIMKNDMKIKKSDFESDTKRNRVLSESNFEMYRRDSREILDNEEKILNQETDETSVNLAIMEKGELERVIKRLRTDSETNVELVSGDLNEYSEKIERILNQEEENEEEILDFDYQDSESSCEFLVNFDDKDSVLGRNENNKSQGLDIIQETGYFCSELPDSDLDSFTGKLYIAIPDTIKKRGVQPMTFLSLLSNKKWTAKHRFLKSSIIGCVNGILGFSKNSGEPHCPKEVLLWNPFLKQLLHLKKLPRASYALAYGNNNVQVIMHGSGFVNIYSSKDSKWFRDHSFPDHFNVLDSVLVGARPFFEVEPRCLNSRVDSPRMFISYDPEKYRFNRGNMVRCPIYPHKDKIIKLVDLKANPAFVTFDRKPVGDQFILNVFTQHGETWERKNILVPIFSGLIRIGHGQLLIAADKGDKGRILLLEADDNQMKPHSSPRAQRNWTLEKLESQKLERAKYDSIPKEENWDVDDLLIYEPTLCIVPGMRCLTKED